MANFIQQRIVSPSQCSKTRNKITRIRKGEIKLQLSDDIIVYIENSEEKSIEKLLELLSEFSKANR